MLIILHVLAVFRGSVLQILPVLQVFRGSTLLWNTPDSSSISRFRTFYTCSKYCSYCKILQYFAISYFRGEAILEYFRVSHCEVLQMAIVLGVFYSYAAVFRDSILYFHRCILSIQHSISDVRKCRRGLYSEFSTAHTPSTRSVPAISTVHTPSTRSIPATSTGNTRGTRSTKNTSNTPSTVGVRTMLGTSAHPWLTSA